MGRFKICSACGGKFLKKKMVFFGLRDDGIGEHGETKERVCIGCFTDLKRGFDISGHLSEDIEEYLHHLKNCPECSARRYLKE